MGSLPLTNDQVQYGMFFAFEKSPVFQPATMEAKLQLAKEAADHYQPRGRYRWRFDVAGQVFRSKKAYVDHKELQHDRTLQSNRELRDHCDKLRVVSRCAL